LLTHFALGLAAAVLAASVLTLVGLSTILAGLVALAVGVAVFIGGAREDSGFYPWG
jgi:hypothetical protein